MKTKISWMIIAAAGILFIACNQVSYKKTKGGMPYKLVASSKGSKIDSGSFIRVQVSQKVNDSVLFSTYGNLPMYIQVTGQVFPYNISELWLSLKEGDSVFTVQAMDTFIKKNPMNVPAQFKNGDRIYSAFKIEKVYKTEDEFREDEKKVKEALTQEEIKVVTDYLAKKNITATKTKSGAFVEIIEPGTGPFIDSGKIAMTLYRGTSFSGKVFDSNMDTSMGRKIEPAPFRIGIAGQPGGLTAGFDESLQLLKKGAKARFYIPSMLAYGPQPPTTDIKPFEHLIFDVEIKDVLDKMPEPAMADRPKIDIRKALDSTKTKSKK
ncbi:MAG: hypothetical protein EPN92_11160 [Chitinophagaceae bacterium]|nr:MAG: hypothetical protein EPN92_11160 [Chitinophagaceae bacterium]